MERTVLVSFQRAVAPATVDAALLEATANGVTSRHWVQPRRVIAENGDMVAVAPYAPRFPFETWITPRRAAPSSVHVSTVVTAMALGSGSRTTG